MPKAVLTKRTPNKNLTENANKEDQLQHLQTVEKEIQHFRYISEELFFGTIGLDAIVGLIPIIGGLYTLTGGFWLLKKAKQIQCPPKTCRWILRLTFLDAAIGFIPGIGDIMDIFIRSHAWSVTEIEKHLQQQISKLEEEGRS